MGPLVTEILGNLIANATLAAGFVAYRFRFLKRKHARQQLQLDNVEASVLKIGLKRSESPKKRRQRSNKGKRKKRADE